MMIPYYRREDICSFLISDKFDNITFIAFELHMSLSFSNTLETL